METGRASRTAEHNALFRTLESSVPVHDRLFEDPLAPAFLTWPLSLVGHLSRVPGGGRVLRAAIDRRWPGVRTSVVARTRLIDDSLTALPDDECSQLVILGAGFDARPYRLRRLGAVPTFEVDHPDTQRAKRRALSKALPDPPSHVRYVASDFNLGELGPAMERSGFAPSVPTLFLWEGVTNYLSEQAVDATMRWCSRPPHRGALLFTYIHSEVLEHPEHFVGASRLQATLRSVNEQLTFGMDPEAMGGYLAGRGLERLWDLGAAEYRARYFGARADGMVGHEFYRTCLARITTSGDA